MNGAELAILQDLLTQAGAQTALLQRLVSLSAGGAGAAGGGGGAGGLAGAAASAVGGIRGLGTVATVAGVASKALGVAFNALSSVVGYAGSIIGGFIGHMVNLGENFIAFTKKAMDGRARLSDFIDVFQDLPVIGKVFSIFSQIAQVGQNYLDLYRRTATVGATFSGSLFDIANMASRAGLGLNDFVNAVTQNSETFAAFGAGNVNVGIEKFAQASGKLLAPGGTYARSIMGLGYTADQAASGLATVMKMQGISSRENLASSDQLAKYTHQYLMELDTLAKLTGKRRDQVQREIDEVERDQLWMSFVDSLGDKNKKAAVMAAVQAAAPFGKAAVDEVKARLRGLDIPVSEAGENLAVFSNGASLNGRALRNSVAAANGDIKKTTDAVLGWLSQSATATGKTLDKFSDAQKASGMLAGMVPDGMLYFSRLLKANGNDLTKTLAEIAKNQKNAADGNAGALGLLEMRFTQFGSKVRELLNKALGPFMDRIIEFSDAVFTTIGNLIQSKEFAQIVKDVADWFETTFSNLKKAWGDGKDYKEKFNGVFKVLGDAMADAWKANKDILINLFGPIISDFWKNDVAPMLAGLMESVLEFIINALRKNSAIARLLFGETNAEKLANADKVIEETQKTIAELSRQRSLPGSRGYEADYDARIRLLMPALTNALDVRQNILGGNKPVTPSTPSRATGSLGMTGKLFENWGSGSEATLHGTESVMTPEQMISMISGAANSELINTLKDLNNTNAQLLVQARITADNSRRTYEAVKVLNPDLFQMA
jgi:hypothetical protein